MKPFRHCAALLLLAAAATTPAPATGAASYDSCTGCIAAVPVVISTQGTWCFRKDLATGIGTGAAITVAANNVTIDCNGFKLGGLAAGAGTQTVGVASTGRLNTAVRGCRIRGFVSAVALSGDGGGHLVEDNILEGNTHTALQVHGDGSLVRRNRILDTGGSTVFLGEAVGMRGSGAIEVVDNEFRGFAPATTEESMHAGSIGLAIASGAGVRVAGNRFRDLQTFGFGLAYAISLSGTTGAEVVDNSIVGVYGGVFCGSQSDVAWRNYINWTSVPVWICTDGGNTVL